MDKWIVWCGLNAEQDALEKIFKDVCVSIRGTTKNEEKIRLEKLWREGDVPILITKPEMFSYGMNWQNCNNMIFVGLSDSYEQFYQAVRRCWRFGQKKNVNVHIVISAKEGCVKENIDRKNRDVKKMQSKMIELTKEITKKELQSTKRIVTEYKPKSEMILPGWEEMKLCM